MTQRIDDVTKPVRAAQQRPTPRWVGWFLILLPSLAAAGPLWGIGPVTLFRMAVIVLFLTAAWDWWRFQDRSRTFFTILGIGLAFELSGVIAMAWSHPPTGPALHDLLSVGIMFALAVALVQLYRTAETVLTIARGWLYLAVIAQAVALVMGWPAGPFDTPSHLAALLVMTVIVMGVGWSLEHDRRLRWAYLAVCVPIPYLVWRSGSTIGIALLVVVAMVWLAVYQWGRRFVVPISLVVIALLPQTRALLADLAVELGDRYALMRAGIVLLRRTDWIGVGPGGFTYALESQKLPYSTHGIVDTFGAIVEIASQYGIGMFVLVTLGGIGLARWAVDRLRRTTKQPLRSAPRIVAIWTLAVVAIWPVLSMMTPTYLGESMSALFVATVAMWARHIERPLGRRVRPSEDALRNLPPAPANPSIAQKKES